MSNAQTHDTATIETLDLAGQPYQLRMLTPQEWSPLTAYLKKASPSPLTRAAAAIHQAKASGTPLDPATADQLLDHAMGASLVWPPRVGSAEWLNLISSTEGADGRLLHEAISRTTLGFTLPDAESLAPRLSPEEWGNVIRVLLRGPRPAPIADASMAEVK